MHFKSDAFVTGNGLNFTFQVAGKYKYPIVPQRSRLPVHSWAALSVAWLTACMWCCERVLVVRLQQNL